MCVCFNPTVRSAQVSSIVLPMERPEQITGQRGALRVYPGQIRLHKATKQLPLKHPPPALSPPCVMPAFACWEHPSVCRQQRWQTRLHPQKHSGVCWKAFVATCPGPTYLG